MSTQFASPLCQFRHIIRQYDSLVMCFISNFRLVQMDWFKCEDKFSKGLWVVCVEVLQLSQPKWSYVERGQFT